VRISSPIRHPLHHPADLGIDLAAAVLVGDQVGDLQSAAAAGCAAILVATGVSVRCTAMANAPPHRRAPDLAAAAAMVETGDVR
jgi:phosphoglycolate phosphatase-like HAD superfamily hydrolase